MSEWEFIAIEEVASFRNGAGIKQDFFSDEGIKLARVSDFTVDSIDLSSCNFVTKDHALKWKSHLLNEGDVVIATVGSWPPNWSSAVGKVIRIPKGVGSLLQNQNTCCIIPDEAKLNKRFLFYRLKTLDFRWFAGNSAGGSANQARLPVEKLKKYTTFIPPLPEQKAIAHILGTLDDKIELNRKMNQTLEAMAQALFKSWFVDFDPVMDNALAAGNAIPEELQAMAEKRALVPHSKKLISKSPELAKEFPSSFVYNETLGKWIPEGWEVKSFGDLIETTIGGDWGKEVPDEKHTEEVKIIRETDIPSLKNCDLGSTPTRFVELKKLKTRKLEVGDIVIEVSGGSPTQSTGRSIRLTENILERLGGIAEPASFCRRLKPINEKFGVLCGEHLTFIYGLGKMWEYQNQSTGIANFQTPYFLEAEMVLVREC